MNLNIFTYTKNDINDVLELLSLGFNHSFSEERWLWLHHENLLAPSSIILVRHEDKLVGIYSVIRKYINYKGNRIVGGRDIDPVVHPDYRGKGIFSMLLNEGKQRFSEIEIFYNFANEKSSPGFIKNGWSKIVYRKLVVINLPVIRDFYRLIILLISLNIRTKNLSISEFALISDFKFENEELIYDGEIYVEKSKSYYKWRYDQNPDKKYRFFICTNNAKQIGVIICSETHNKLSINDIACIKGYCKFQLLKLFLINFQKLNIKSKFIISWDGICYNSKKLMIPLKLGHFLVRGKIESLHNDFISTTWEMGPGESEFR